MLISRGKPLTVAQTAGRTATEHRCAACGESTVILTDVDVANIEHRCPTRVAGAVWTVVARPATADQLRARAGVDLVGGLLTVEQAGAHGAEALVVLRTAAAGAGEAAA